MSQTDHAPLAPSSAARIVACPGSVSLAARYPQPATIESQEGTAAHWALAELLHGRDVAVGQIAPNGVMLNEEMIEAAELGADYILARGPVGAIESTLQPCARLHPENYGTPDHALWLNVENLPRTLYIDDFKYGHKFVDVFENWQLMNYATLALAQLGIDGHMDQTVKVVMTIIQPRNYHRDGPIRTWSIMASDLRAYVNIMRAKFEEAMTPDAKCTVNSECKYCPGRHACQALAIAASGAMDRAYESIPLEMTSGAVGRELRMLRRAAKQLDARVSGLEEQALSLISRGENVPFFSIQHGQGRTVFADEKQAIALGEMMGVPIVKPGVMTPKQAIKAGLPKELVDAYSVTPRGKAELIEDDGRQAARVFK